MTGPMEPRYTVRIRPPGMYGRQLSIECATREQVLTWLWDHLDTEMVGRTPDPFVVEWFGREGDA